MYDQQRLDVLIAANHACLWIPTREEEYALELLHTAAINAGRDIWIWSASGGVRCGLLTDKTEIPNTENPGAALYHFARQATAPSLCVTLDLAAHLDDPVTLRALRDVIRGFRETDHTLVMVDHADALPEVIAGQATRLDLSLPDEEELHRIIRDTIRRLHQKRPVNANVKKHELENVVRNLRGLTRQQAEQIIVDCVAEDRTFDARDINAVLAHKRRRLHRDGVLEYIESPVDLADIGGLSALKAWLSQRREALSDRGRQFGLTPPRGILLLGVQGSGKSLSAKAVAASWARPLLRLDPSVLFDRYIGESERRLRIALRQAEMMAPIVLWIDEIEKGFASAASHSVDGGLSQRMFGTLLTWMQEHTAPVFLVATANNIGALPPELLRKGRFDEIFFVDLPTEPVRREIAAIHIRKRGRDPNDFDLAALAEVSEGFSGAEIEQAVIAAMHAAFAGKGELNTARVQVAMRASPPLSVTMAEHVESLRGWARGRCVPAD